MKISIALLILSGVGIGYLLFPDVFHSIWELFLRFLEDPQAFRSSIEEMGTGGYFFIILLQVIQVVLFPLPGQISTIIAGVFGSSWGVLLGIGITMVGLTIGASAAFLIGRYFFRDWVSRKLSGKKGWQKFAELSSGRGLWVIGLIYVVPGFPNDFMCYVLGLSRAPFLKFLLVTTVCRIPNVIITFLLGYFAGFSNWWWVGIIGTIIVIISVLGYLYRGAIEERIDSWFTKKE
jgi:uncharacterized membrane protein YdjX (TVP38/TMEM64 family)